MAEVADEFDDMVSLFGESPPPESETEEIGHSSHAQNALPNTTFNQDDLMDDAQPLPADSPSLVGEAENNEETNVNSYDPRFGGSVSQNELESFTNQNTPPLSEVVSQSQPSNPINRDQSTRPLSEVSDVEESDRARKCRRLIEDNRTMRYSFREGARQKDNESVPISGFPYIPDFDKSGTYEPTNYSEPESVASHRISKPRRKKRLAESSAPAASLSAKGLADKGGHEEDLLANEPAGDDSPTVSQACKGRGSLRMLFKFREPAKGVLRRIKEDNAPYADGTGRRGHDNWPLCATGYSSVVDFKNVCGDTLQHCHQPRPRDLIDTKTDPRLKEIFLGDPTARGCKQCVCLGIVCSLVGGGEYECEACKEMNLTCEPVTEPILKAPCDKCKINPVYYNDKGMRRRVQCEYVKTPQLRGACICCRRRGLRCIAGPLGGTTRPYAAQGDDARRLEKKIWHLYRHGFCGPVQTSLRALDSESDAADQDVDARPWQPDDNDTLFVQPDLREKAPAARSKVPESYRTFFELHKGSVGKIFEKVTIPNVSAPSKENTQNGPVEQSLQLQLQQVQQSPADLPNENLKRAVRQLSYPQLRAKDLAPLSHGPLQQPATQSAALPLPQNVPRTLPQDVSQPVPRAAPQLVSQSALPDVSKDLPRNVPQDVPDTRRDAVRQPTAQKLLHSTIQAAPQSTNQSERSGSKMGQQPAESAQPSQSTAGASTQPKQTRHSRAPRNGGRGAKTKSKARKEQATNTNPRLSFHWAPSRHTSGPHARPLSVESVIRGGDSEDEDFAK